MVVPGGGFAKTQEAMRQFDEVVQWAIDENSRIGYFAALYRGVTRGIYGWLYAPTFDPDDPGRVGGMNGFFEDAERLDHFVGAFAQRFYDAWRQRDTLDATHPWAVHFAQCERRRRITINQYLLTGANAHMNFDLPMAATRIAGEFEDAATDLPLFRSLQTLRGDFDRINDVLGFQVETLQEAAREVSPVLRLGRFLAKRTAQAVEIAIAWFRAAAWKNAESLIQRPTVDSSALVSGLDPEELAAEVGRWGEAIGKPAWYLRPPIALVAAFEPRSARKVIRSLLMADADEFRWP